MEEVGYSEKPASTAKAGRYIPPSPNYIFVFTANFAENYCAL
jgi:hypothetical protein